MERKNIIKYLWVISAAALFAACGIPAVSTRSLQSDTPASYQSGIPEDTVSAAFTPYRRFFTDPQLTALIDTALQNNQELNIMLQEIEIRKNEIRIRKGEYLPSVNIRAGGGIDKVSRYTNIGALEANTDIVPGKKMPEPLGDLIAGAYATWEVDIWKKLRNATKAAQLRYLSSVEGRRFTVTHLVAEIANSYYELVALDNQLAILKQNIELQQNALRIVRVQKEATRVTELAVRRFEVQVACTQSLQFEIQQRIIETENRINFLVGRFPRPVNRNKQALQQITLPYVNAGLPSQLLFNRPDIRQLEQELAAAKLDIAVARAQFYPSLGIQAGVGFQAFNPAHFIKAPESLLFSLAGDLVAPLINKNAIKANFKNANARQVRQVFKYEQTLLNGYIETVNQLSKIDNLQKSFTKKSEQVDALTESVTISNNLFSSARADYMEVLLTQREALEAKFDLIETKMNQLQASINLYQALGGGWR